MGQSPVPYVYLVRSSQVFLKGQPAMLVMTPRIQQGLLGWKSGTHQLHHGTSIGHGIYDPNTYHHLWTHSSFITMRKPNPHLRHQYSSIEMFGQPKLLQKFPLWIVVCRGCTVGWKGVEEYM